MKKIKRALSAILAATMLTSAFGVVSAQAISRPADLDITDITHLQKGIAGLVELDAETIRTYDVNGDGEIDITEVTYWQKVLAGIIVLDEAPTKLSLNITSATLGVGETLKLVPSSDCSNVKVTYSTSNKNVATVATNGTITAKAAGTAKITATTDNGIKATCTITVKPAATSVTLSKTSMSLEIGQSYNLSITLPSNTASYKKTVSSSNTKVATATLVNGKCKVTAKTAGTATITVKLASGAKATCTVTVKKSINTVEREMEALINQYRKSLGLKTLTVTSALQRATDIRAKEASESFSHTRPNGTSCFTVLSELNISYTGAGECLAGYSMDPASTLNQWKNSKGHNDIITGSNFTHMAAGCYEANGRYYWVFFAIRA